MQNRARAVPASSRPKGRRVSRFARMIRRACEGCRKSGGFRKPLKVDTARCRVA